MVVGVTHIITIIPPIIEPDTVVKVVVVVVHPHTRDTVFNTVTVIRTV